LRQQVGQKYNFEGIIGQSAQMKQVRVLMEKAIESGMDVLITGETGTGKELVAQAIHRNSSRKNGPLYAINCGEVTRDLIASTLFGHRKGAFTGATEDRQGLFEAASGGTLIIDEIGNLPAETQISLLRVLQERKVRRLGENRLCPVNVRLIAITNRNLDAARKAGEFRDDLYYRLNQFPIDLPPLRERLDDIPLLAQHLLQKFCQSRDRTVDGFGPGVIDMLQSHRWEGNVRELENEIARAAALVEDGMKIQIHHFSEHLASADALIQETLSENHILTEATDRFQRRLVEQTLMAYNWNRNEAARRLGLDRGNLRKLMKRLGIRQP